MEKQYLIVGEQIAFRNNKLSIINVMDQFMALQLPAKFNFDLAFICGPEWFPGEYELTFKVRSEAMENYELGSITLNITDRKGVFNAIASNLNFVIGKDSGNVTFIVERDGEEIFTREYPVTYLLKVDKSREASLR
ncbi:MAG: hypothetical protein PHC34_04045 [Candidatus Gastranaerophilales bacterium]|nr:hypothetical protein [Candidatus Gastranaerophilales bacterium]